MYKVRARAWILTNNYKENKLLTDNEIIKKISQLPNIKYYTFCLEKGIGKSNEKLTDELIEEYEGTLHHHIYLIFNNAVQFDTIKKVFDKANIQKRKGTHKQAKKYINKKETKVSDHEVVEWGEEPIGQGKRTDLVEILELIEDNATINEIKALYPSQYMNSFSKISRAIEEHRKSEYSKKFRHLEVYYICDESGKGKTRFVMEKYGYENVCKVSDYDSISRTFDNYNSQDVILFDEFRDSISLSNMLNYLDGYPLQLPARYYSRTASYTKVFIISNWSFDRQYRFESKEDKKAWKRRFTAIGNLKEIKLAVKLQEKGLIEIENINKLEEIEDMF